MIYKLNTINGESGIIEGEYHIDNSFAWGAPEETRIYAIIERAAARGWMAEICDGNNETVRFWDYSQFPDGFQCAREVIEWIVANCDVEVDVREIERPDD